MPAKKPKSVPFPITPQPKQVEALTHDASIVVYGGAAGSGKTFTSLLLPLYLGGNNSKMKAVVFREEMPEITAPGGPWDTSYEIYSKIHGAIANKTEHKWTLPAGGTIKFSGMQQDSDRYNWQGSQLDIVIFDEGAHFSEERIMYMLTRLRGTSGIAPKMLITCNPDPDSFIAFLIKWYLDEDGFPIPERSGRTRWFARQSGEWKWANTPEAITSLPGWGDAEPKSFTFIAANIQDNQILLEQNPGYIANLKAESSVQRARLLDGNWKIRAEAGTMFNRAWFKTPFLKVGPAPELYDRLIRGWDLAATNGAGDWTVGFLIGKVGSVYYLIECVRGQWSAGARNKVILQTAQTDSEKYSAVGVSQWFEQEPGSGGKGQIEELKRLLDGYNVRSEPSMNSKMSRAEPFSAQCEAGNVMVIEGDWNGYVLEELHGFPDAKHDDIVDALSLAYNKLSKISGPVFI